MRKHTKRSGIIFLDALLALFCLSIGAAAFFSLSPILKKSEMIAHEQAIARQMTNRMIDQLQMLGSAQVTANYLTQLSLINPGQSASPYSFSHMPLDDTTHYSPAQALPNGTGTLTVATIDSGSVRVLVEIDWTSVDGTAQSIKTGTIVGGYR